MYGLCFHSSTLPGHYSKYLQYPTSSFLYIWWRSPCCGHIAAASGKPSLYSVRTHGSYGRFSARTRLFGNANDSFAFGRVRSEAPLDFHNFCGRQDNVRIIPFVPGFLVYYNIGTSHLPCICASQTPPRVWTFGKSNINAFNTHHAKRIKFICWKRSV